VEKVLKRTKENLKEKIGEKELELILKKQTEINELESQLNNLQIQAQDSIQTQIQIPPKK